MNDSSRRSIRRAQHGQRGLTLIEMLVAMTIGLFLLGGVLTIVSGLRVTFGAQNQLAQLQDNERLAMTLLTDVIQAAGYFPDPTKNTLVGSFPKSTAFATAGQVITGTSVTAGPDVVTARYATISGDGVINCLGEINSSGSAVPLSNENEFSVVNGQLQCKRTTVKGTLTVPLVSGVQNLKIWYGVKTGGTSQTCTDSYMRASEVTAGAYWSSICSVKVSLTFVNPIDSTKPIQFNRVIAVMSTAGANT
jgi:type IV pilus assembly protein PilW